MTDGATPKPYTQSPPTAKEQEEVDLLLSMMGSDIHYDVALTVLRRNWGDIQKAAAALLEGDTGVETPAFPANFGQDNTRTAGPRTPPRTCTFIELNMRT